jgi:hypothetical protein
MKKHLSLILLLSTVAGVARGHGDVYSHSFFSMKPHFQINSPEATMLFRNSRMEDRENGYGSAFQLVAFGGRSERENDLAKYFLPWGKSSIVVQEINNYDANDHTNGVYDRDVDARHLNIKTVNGDFKSTVCFAPHHTFFGVALDWKQALTCCSDGAVNWFFEVSAPLVHVRNDMHMVEAIENNGGGVVDAIGLDDAPRVGNAIDAFKQPNWKFGKILSCKKIVMTAQKKLQQRLPIPLLLYAHVAMIARAVQIAIAHARQAVLTRAAIHAKKIMTHTKKHVLQMSNYVLVKTLFTQIVAVSTHMQA